MRKENQIIYADFPGRFFRRDFVDPGGIGVILRERIIFRNEVKIRCDPRVS
jgi:hypothetical protein